MTAQPITVNLPETLYAQLQARAQHQRRSIANELLDLLATAALVADELPDDRAEE